MSIFKNKFLKIQIVLLAVLILIWTWVLIEEKQEFLEINFYDIGQGDAIFIETPNKRQILIDGGPDLTILEKLGKELPFWDRYIDLVILTHPEYDHLGGLIEVVKRYKIGGILTTGVVRDTAEYKEWKKVVENKNIPIYIAQIGEVIELDKEINLVVLHPSNNLNNKKFEKSNNTSMVTQLFYKDFELLLTGDIEREVEQALVGLGINLNSDILKVAHHGSKTSTTKNFVKAVNPIVAVISAGKDNFYNHPHREVLENLAGIPIFITGQDGDIKVLSDGTKFRIKQSHSSKNN